MLKKITVVGAGMVGGTVAALLAERNYADIVLVDIVEGLPQGKALDLCQGGPARGFEARVRGTNTYRDTAGSDLCIVTSGLPRKPGMTREDLLLTNAAIVREVTSSIAEVSPHALLLIVSNPLDAMAHLAHKVSGFPPERVFGMSGVLDSARFRTFIAWELGVSVKDVQALVLGGHGEQMVPLPRYAAVSGIPLSELLPQEKIDALVKRTIEGGAEIVSLLKTGSAFYAPAAAVVEMADAILLDRKRLLPASAYLNGQHGIKDVYCGIPVILGSRGVERVLELPLTDQELSTLRRSAEAVREMLQVLGV